MAVLDVNLGAETSEPVARRLSEIGIPFAFATGYGETSKHAERHPQAPILQKPFALDALKEAALALLSQGRTG